jgi:GTP-binding protein
MTNQLDFEQAAFLTSAAKLQQCPPDTGREVAFCGRSNAGKSSAINCLTGNSKLARTSKTPGRTQLINFFSVQDDIRLVDLPGFGYAKVPEKMRESWHQNIDAYLRNRESLVGIILVMDIRHPMKDFDRMMIEWSGTTGIPLHILLTKADKLKHGPGNSVRLQITRELPENASVQLFSSARDIGREALVKQLGAWLAPP